MRRVRDDNFKCIQHSMYSEGKVESGWVWLRDVIFKSIQHSMYSEGRFLKGNNRWWLYVVGSIPAGCS